MAKRYTQCCKPADYSGWGGGVALTTIIGVALAFVTGAWVLLAPTLIADLVLFCEWWLYRRLVCLDGEKCAIGMVVTVEPVENKGGFERFDTDFSINLLLAPHTIYTSRATIENDGISGSLIAEQNATNDIGLGFVGYTAKQWQNYPDTPVLHAEFEGGGIYDLYQAAKAALVVSAVGAVVCSIPVIGWAACIVIMAVAAIIAVVGVIVALNDKGSPSDVNAELTEIHTNDPTGRGADILVIKGDWIYDSFHDGWNEIHPILQAQRIGTWSGAWGFDARLARDAWCEALDDADSTGTRNDQLKPENQWEVHPVVDGCKPEREPEPIG
jgi:hypothetical protein